MQAQEKGKRLFRIATEFAESVVALVDKLQADDYEEMAYKEAMLFFFCKAYKSYQAIQRLWLEGFAEDAFILTRTIFEIALQARYMSQDPRERARKFFLHYPVAQYRYYLKLKELDGLELTKRFEARAKDLAKLKEAYESHKSDYQGLNWWGDSIRWLAKQSGQPFEARYAWTYAVQSTLAHSSMAAAKHYVEEDGNDIRVSCYPKPDEDILVPQEATLFSMDVATQFVNAWELPVEDDYNKAMAALKALLT